MDILARVAGIQDVQRLAKSVDETGDEMRDAATDAALLDRAVDELSDEIAELNRELLRTGDVDVFERIKVDRSTLATLRRMRRELGDVGDIGGEAGRGFVRTFGDALSALPPHLRGALIAGVASAAAVLAPLLGAALAAAVVGGVGAGGIVGGIVSAARDQRVRSAAEGLVDNVSQPFDQLGSAFVDPIRSGLDELGLAGREVFGGLVPEIRALSPELRQLAGGFADLLREAEPGLSDALEAARPVLQALARELPEIGEAFSDMLSTISENADAAAEGLTTLLNITEVLLRATGSFVSFLTGAFEGAAKLARIWERSFGFLSPLPAVVDENTKAVLKFEDGVAGAGEAGEDAGLQIAGGFDDAAESISATNSILIRHRDSLRAQTDPMFALLDAQGENAEAQREYNEAVDEFGRKSPEAREAFLNQAQAAVALQGAVAEASGTVEGDLSPAMRAALIAAGFTKEELKRLEGEFDRARRAGEKFEGNYFANIKITTRFRTSGNPPPIGLGQLSGIGGRFAAFQHGGQVFGPSGLDRVPAMLTAGEFVVRREQAQRHLELLRAINSGGASPAGGASGRGVPGSQVIENVNVTSISERFSTKQVFDDLALHGAS